MTGGAAREGRDGEAPNQSGSSSFPLIPGAAWTISAAAAALSRAVARAISHSTAAQTGNAPSAQHQQMLQPVSPSEQPHTKGKAAQLPVPRGHPQPHSQGKALSTLTSLHMISSERGFIKPSIMFPVVATHISLPMSSTGQHITHFPDYILPDSRYF